MPNWCESIIHVYGPNERLKEVLDLVKSDDLTFDFNKIIPRPAIYKNTASGFKDFEIPCATSTVTLTSWHEGDDGKARPFTEAEHEELSGHGAFNWYDWSIRNWNTKWNACHVDEPVHDEAGEALRFQFDTAWEPPIPVIEELRNRFPDLEIIAFYRDETENTYTDY
ncbi:MAG: hypothetical protein LPL29_13330 [Alphaproteobacteria bacterium]|nr:hypothetical protein [Alphaproteobacteria bacterium]